MKKLNNPVQSLDFFELLNFIKKHRYRQVKLHYNTYMYEENGVICITLHGNKIAEITKENTINVCVSSWWASTNLTSNRISEVLGINTFVRNRELFLEKQFPLVTVNNLNVSVLDKIDTVYVPYSHTLAKTFKLKKCKLNEDSSLLAKQHISSYDQSLLVKLFLFLKKIGYKKERTAKLSIYVDTQGIYILDYTPKAFLIKRYKSVDNELFISNTDFKDLCGLKCSFLFTPPQGSLAQAKDYFQSNF